MFTKLNSPQYCLIALLAVITTASGCGGSAIRSPAAPDAARTPTSISSNIGPIKTEAVYVLTSAGVDVEGKLYIYGGGEAGQLPSSNPLTLQILTPNSLTVNRKYNSLIVTNNSVDYRRYLQRIQENFLLFDIDLETAVPKLMNAQIVTDVIRDVFVASDGTGVLIHTDNTRIYPAIYDPSLRKLNNIGDFATLSHEADIGTMRNLASAPFVIGIAGGTSYSTSSVTFHVYQHLSADAILNPVAQPWETVQFAGFYRSAFVAGDDSWLLFSASEPGIVRSYSVDKSSGKLTFIRECDCRLRRVAASSLDGKHIVGVGPEEYTLQVRLFDPVTGEVATTGTSFPLPNTLIARRIKVDRHGLIYVLAERSDARGGHLFQLSLDPVTAELKLLATQTFPDVPMDLELTHPAP